MLVVDIEATGTNYEKHSIVSIGALDLYDPENQFYRECRIWNGAHIEDEAMEVNGFSKEEITDPQKIIEGEAVKEFLDWSKNLPDKTLAGQNVSFDRDFLKAAAERIGLDWKLAYRTIDTHTMCYTHMIKRGIEPPFDKKHKRSALDLDKILNYIGIPDEPEPHNALTGALSHAECISRLLYDKKMLDLFNKYPIPWYNEQI